MTAGGGWQLISLVSRNRDLRQGCQPVLVVQNASWKPDVIEPNLSLSLSTGGDTGFIT